MGSCLKYTNIQASCDLVGFTLNVPNFNTFLGAFAKFAKIDYQLRHAYLGLSVLVEQLRLHSTNFYEL